MREPKIPENEKERLRALRSFDLINNIGQSAFDDIVKIAAFICKTPISLITLITEDKQIFKAKIGLDGVETSRAVSFCGHGILTPDKPFIVNSASSDERFADNPLVKGAPHIEFYAGVPLKTISGHGLGSLCVIDTKKRTLDDEQLNMLKLLSIQVMRLFELKRNTEALEQKDQALVQAIKQLNTFTADVCHDMKTSLRNIELTAEVIKKTNDLTISQQSLEKLNNIEAIIQEAMGYMNSMDKFTTSLGEVNETFTLLSVDDLLNNIISNLSNNEKLEVSISEKLPKQLRAPVALNHIFFNILKASSDKIDEANSKIEIEYELKDTYHQFQLSDNFSDNYKRGEDYKLLINTGAIELAIAKQLAILMGGILTNEKNQKDGTTFRLLLPQRLY